MDFDTRQQAEWACKSLEEASTDYSSLTLLKQRTFRINDRLFWGSVIAAYDPKFLTDNAITDIISLTSQQAEKVVVPMDLEYRMAQLGNSLLRRHRFELGYFPTSAEIKDTAGKVSEIISDPSRRVYLHCVQGMERTPLVLSQIQDLEMTKMPIDALDLNESSFSQTSIAQEPERKLEKIVVFRSRDMYDTFRRAIYGTPSEVPVKLVEDVAELAQQHNSLVLLELLESEFRKEPEEFRLAEAIAESDNAVFMWSLAYLPYLSDLREFGEFSDFNLIGKALKMFEDPSSGHQQKETINRIAGFRRIDPKMVYLGHEY